MSNTGRVVRITNIDKEDFDFAFGGMPFLVKAGESRLFPFEVAEHCAKHLARKMLIRGDIAKSIYDPSDQTGGLGKCLATPEEEERLMTKIMVEEMSVEEDRPRTENEILMDRIAKLEKMLQKEDKEEVNQEPVQPIAQNGVYTDKAEVIAELNKRGIKFDSRQNKQNLEKLLN